ncbi:hypothetical protein RGQ29_018587 [Quercus rubra]|uniref:Protein kinase domain-containing protein n=1 Tax=Quercus rubra TaxID=3512 RepID=A0AAN7IUQ7_QUERU|nr:hypothetical protein RGQ29_018587 [Quercus rubra]
MILSSFVTVIALELLGHKLRGTITPYIGNLTFLRVTDLGNNIFYGKIPKEVGHLFRLQHLNIQSNTLGGEIPASLANCTKLRVMTIAALGFEVNQLGGALPANIGLTLPNLKVFTLGDNKFYGPIPGRDLNFLMSLTNYNKMELLTFAINQFKGVLPNSIGNLSTQLHLLYIGGNQISGLIPAALQNLINLISLGVEENFFTGVIPTCFGNFLKMQGWYLSGNKLLGKIPSSIGNLTQLVGFNLCQNNLEGSIPPSIGNCLSLQQLDVSQNYLNEVIPQQVFSLFSLSLLLNLSYNSFSGKLPVEVGNLKNINSLDVSENNLSGEILTTNGNLLNLDNLYLQGPLKESYLHPWLNEKALSFWMLRETTYQDLFQRPSCFIISCSLLDEKKKNKTKPSSIASKMDLLPTISYKVLHRATNGFSLNNLIGSGSFGSVYKGVLNQEEIGAIKSFMVECNVLRNVRHRNLVKILTCCSNYENQSKNLSFLQRIIIAIDVASTLNYINILLDSEMIAHVSNFGLASLLTSTNDSSQKCTSEIAQFPSIPRVVEYGMGGEVSTEGDLYSYGVLVLEMFTGRMPIDDMFKDGLNLHNFVKMTLPKRLAQVVDPMLFPREVEELRVATGVKMAIDDNDNEIEVEETNNIEDSRHVDDDMQKCLLSILNKCFH